MRCDGTTDLDALLKAEGTEREVRSASYQMKAARVPAYEDLAGHLIGMLY